jgi:GWxTD domain-containing protein
MKVSIKISFEQFKLEKTEIIRLRAAADILKRSLLILSLFILIQPLGAQGIHKGEFPAIFKKWLEEEVVYIITPKERDVFLQLETDDERTLFIEAFWKQRDPTPGSPENEFKTQHYRRIAYSNSRFGFGSTKPGWKTDRGRMYIILGEPMQMENYSSQRELRDTEIWFYQDMTNYGLNQAFYLVFIRKDMASDFKLYSPANDGPHAFFFQSLMADPADYATAYEKLREINPAIAEVSLSLIPGEGPNVAGSASLASDILLKNIALVPRKMVKDLYAEKLLKYKGLVDVEYSVNYIDSDYLVQAIRDESGVFIVNYLVEPERLSIGRYEVNYYTHFILNGMITDQEDNTIYQFEREYSFAFDKDKVDSMARTPIQLNDMFPLVPGEYKFSLILRNTVSKEFSSFEETLNIPNEFRTPTMSPLLLCYNTQTLNDKDVSSRPFQIDKVLLFTQPANTFTISDTFKVFFQLYGLTESLIETGKISFQIMKGEQTVKSLDREMKDIGKSYNVLQEISLIGIPSDYYVLRVTLQDQSGFELAAKSKEFALSPAPGFTRPLVKTIALPKENDAITYYRLGTQLSNQGRYEMAALQFEKARQKKPDELEFAVGLARTYLILNKYENIPLILVPFLQVEKASYEVYYLLGKAAQYCDDYKKAIGYFQEAVSHFGLSPTLLNSLGECQFRLKHYPEAEKAWKKSLELNADQPQIRKLLEALKKDYPHPFL